MRAHLLELPPEIEIPLLTDSRIRQQDLVTQSQRLSISEWSCRRTTLNRTDRWLKQYGILMDQYFSVISPQSWWLLAWNLLIFLSIFYNFLEIPIVLFMTGRAYDEQFGLQTSLAMQILMIYLFTIDLFFVRPRVAFEKGGHLIKEHSEIARHYFGGQALVDGLALVILVIFVLVAEDMVYLKLLFYLKYSSLIHMDIEISDRLEGAPLSKAIYQFMKWICFIVFVTNIYACLYFAIDYYYYVQRGFYYQKGFLWLNGSPSLYIIDLYTTFTWQVWYTYALFWAMQTARSVGYGIATPRNPAEVLFCNMAIMSTIVLFVFFTNGILKIIDDYSRSTTRMQTNFGTIARLEVQFHLKKEIAEQLRKHISDQAFAEQQQAQIEELMYDRLSPNLHGEFAKAYKAYILHIIPVFQLLISVDPRFATQLASMIRTRHFRRGHAFFMEADSTTRLFLTHNGRTISKRDGEKQEKNSQGWEIIGQGQFFFDQSMMEAYAKQFLPVSYIRQDQFRNLLQNCSKAKQKYYELLHGVKQNKKSTELFLVDCLYCGDSHLDKFCWMRGEWRNNIRICNPQNEDMASTILEENQQRKKYQRKRMFQQNLRGYRLQDLRQANKVCNFDEYYPYYNI